MVETISFSRRSLPHWLVADRTYFVTRRIANSLPAAVVEELRAERDALHQQKCSDESRWLKLYRAQFVRVDEILDADKENDECKLTNGDIPNIILKSLDWLVHDAGWCIYAATIMSTHIHLVMRNNKGRTGELLDDIEKFKRFTGSAANRSVGRTGRFWARDDFDHWCRTQDKVNSAITYVRQNPVKAGLVKEWQEWPWTVELLK